MIRMRVSEIIAAQNRTAYSVWKELDINWVTWKNILSGSPTKIRYEVIDTLCRVLEVDPGDLFVWEADGDKSREREGNNGDQAARSGHSA